MANDNIVRMLSVSMQGNVNFIMKMSLQTERLLRMQRCPEKIRSAQCDQFITCRFVNLRSRYT